jgi:hypothetical protein
LSMNAGCRAANEVVSATIPGSFLVFRRSMPKTSYDRFRPRARIVPIKPAEPVIATEIPFRARCAIGSNPICGTNERLLVPRAGDE